MQINQKFQKLRQPFNNTYVANVKNTMQQKNLYIEHAATTRDFIYLILHFTITSQMFPHSSLCFALQLPAFLDAFTAGCLFFSILPMELPGTFDDVPATCIPSSMHFHICRFRFCVK